MEDIESSIKQYISVKWPEFKNKELKPRPTHTSTDGTGCCYKCGKAGNTGTTEGHHNPNSLCVCFGICKLKANVILFATFNVKIFAARHEQDRTMAIANNFWYFKCQEAPSNLSRKKRSTGYSHELCIFD